MYKEDKITLKKRRAYIKLLSESFIEDEIISEWLRVDFFSLLSIRLWFILELKNLKKKGAYLIEHESKLGIAILYPPHVENKESILSKLNFMDVIFSGLKRLPRLSYLREKLGAYRVNSKYAYLSYICVHEFDRHKGIGSEILKEIIRICDERKWGCILETADKRTRFFFESYGWVIKDSFFLPWDHNKEIFVMLKPL